MGQITNIDKRKRLKLISTLANAGLNQDDIADIMGIHSTTVSRYMSQEKLKCSECHQYKKTFSFGNRLVCRECLNPDWKPTISRAAAMCEMAQSRGFGE